MKKNKYLDEVGWNLYDYNQDIDVPNITNDRDYVTNVSMGSLTNKDQPYNESEEECSDKEELEDWSNFDARVSHMRRNISAESMNFYDEVQYLKSLLEQEPPLPPPAGQAMDPGGEGEELPDESVPEAGTMPGEEPIKDPEYIGRTFTLKKIYSRLVSIDSYLEGSSDVKLLRLKKYVSSSLELFQILIFNLRSFQDKIDKIIVLFYEFLLLIYRILSQYYREKEDDES